MQVVSKKSSEHYVWGGGCDGWHLLKSKNVSVIEERVPGGGFEMRHRHNRAEQFFYVLKGRATIEIEGARHVVTENEGIHVPPGAAHQLINEGDTDLRFIVISTPPSHGDREVVEQ